MKYQTSDPKQEAEAWAYLTKLTAQDAIVEITKVSPKRSLNQNSYLHLLLGIYGSECGYTIEEAKILFKRQVNPDIYVYEKNGIKFLRSSADLDTKETTLTIERFKDWAAKQDIQLPDAEDKQQIMYYQNHIEQYAQYL